MEAKNVTHTLIHDERYERMVLGSLVTSSRSISEVREYLTKECFYDPVHQEIYEAIRTVDQEGGTVNYMTVNAALSKAGAKATIDDVISLAQTSTTGPILDYALRLRELEIRRQLWILGQKLVLAGSSETEDVADIQEDARRTLTEIFSSTTTDVHTLSEAYTELQAQIIRNQQYTGEIYGTPTGFREIDRRGGLAPTDLVVVAGETSMGKTSFATALAINAINAGHPVAFYSMEMTNIQLAARIAAMQSGVNSRSILQDVLPMDKITAVDRAMRSLPGDLCFFDDDATASFDKIAASIRALALRYGIKGAVVDYLQILNVNMRSVNKEQAMGEVSRRLKNLAKELGIWIIALSQLNRDKDRPRPSLDRLRDSGQIGEAADMILLVYRPEVKTGTLRYPDPFSSVSTRGTAFVDVAKGRNTGIYQFVCGFNSATTCFYDIAPEDLPHIQIPAATVKDAEVSDDFRVLPPDQKREDSHLPF